jgi:hypothetical protein
MTPIRTGKGDEAIIGSFLKGTPEWQTSVHTIVKPCAVAIGGRTRECFVGWSL